MKCITASRRLSTVQYRQLLTTVGSTYYNTCLHIFILTGEDNLETDKKTKPTMLNIANPKKVCSVLQNYSLMYNVMYQVMAKVTHLNKQLDP